MTILNKKLPNKALLASALSIIIKAAAKNCSLLFCFIAITLSQSQIGHTRPYAKPNSV